MLLAASPSLQATEVSTRSFTGHAIDLDTGDLLYTEVHNETLHASGDVALTTVYYEPGGSTIAERTIDFSEHPLAPPYHFKDTRADYFEGLVRDDGELVVYRQLPTESSPERKRLGQSEHLVADAGFDRLVLSEWDRLQAGVNIRADFLVPSRLRTLRFVIRKEREWSLEGEPVVSFKMTSSNPLLRLLMGAIRVTYHQRDRFLMRYEGISNLKGANGDMLKVQINFPLEERNEWQPAGKSSTRVARNEIH